MRVRSAGMTPGQRIRGRECRGRGSQGSSGITWSQGIDGSGRESSDFAGCVGQGGAGSDKMEASLGLRQHKARRGESSMRSSGGRARCTPAIRSQCGSGDQSPADLCRRSGPARAIPPRGAVLESLNHPQSRDLRVGGIDGGGARPRDRQGPRWRTASRAGGSPMRPYQ